MAHVFDSFEPAQLLTGTREARQAIARGELIVLPTDTVYGVAADAFNPDAVARLLEAKGRGRQSPPPVLVADLAAARALAEDIPESVARLAEAFWPGPLTIVLPAQPSLSWDLGDTGGTVALRIPAHDLALELLRETGPLAVSSANLTAQPAAQTAAEADEMLGAHVAVIIDAGPAATEVPSTIIDGTLIAEGRLRVLRAGGVSLEQLQEVCPELEISLAPKTPRPADSQPQPESAEDRTDAAAPSNE